MCLKMHEGERSQCRCALCGETLLCRFELSRHRCQSLDSELLQSDKESLYIRWQNSKSKAYLCPVCNMMFKETSSWQRHMALHLGQERYKCPVCPRKFHNDKDARKHYMKLHTGGHPFKGKWCLSSYVYSHEKKHNRALHPFSGSSKKTAVDEDEDGSESKPTKECRAKYRCDTCCKKFSYFGSYQKHMNKNHNVGVIHWEGLPFCCALCGKRFPLRYHLNRHGCVALHTKLSECTNVTNGKASDYECAVCNRNFVYKQTWEAHMSLHSVKQEQQCPVCCLQLCYGKELDARFHMKTRDGESMPNEIEAKEKYLCSVCGKLYEFNPHLENRAIGVTDPNPYLCSLCSKGLGCKVNLTHQTEEQTEEHLLSRSQDSTSCVDDQGVCENQVMPNLTKHRHEENVSSPDICTEEVKECLDYQKLDDSRVMPGSTKCCLVEIQEDDNASDTEEEFVDDSDSKVMPDSSWQNFEEKYQCFLCDERLGTEDELKSHLQVHCS